MKNILIFIILFALCSCQTGEREGLLWKISGNGLEKPSYLFGTWHGDTELRNPSFLDSVPGFHHAFNSVDQFIYEGFNKNDDMSLILLPKETIYADLLDENEIQILDSVLMKKIKTKSSKMNLRPSYLTFILSQIDTQQKVEDNLKKKVKELEMADLAFSDSLFYEKRNAIHAERDIMDIQLVKRAAKSGLPIIGLDSIIEFDLFPHITKLTKSKSLADEAKDLIKSINSNNDSLMNIAMANTLPMRRAYREQDIRKVGKYKEKQTASLASEEFTQKDFEKLMQTILVDRNKDWIKHLPSLLAYKSSFIAVGAVHLPYEDGLINLLRKEGYTLTPVTK